MEGEINLKRLIESYEKRSRLEEKINRLSETSVAFISVGMAGVGYAAGNFYISYALRSSFLAEAWKHLGFYALTPSLALFYLAYDFYRKQKPLKKQREEISQRIERIGK